jgi:hypothetical protein
MNSSLPLNDEEKIAVMNPFDLNEFLTDVVFKEINFRREKEKENMNFFWDPSAADATEDLFEVDPKQFQNIFHNLYSSSFLFIYLL